MKQTNNAIKFLMAQYRSIFQHAFIKGLAATVALTAGLSTFSAQAADAPLVLDKGTYSIQKTGNDGSYTYTLQKDDTDFNGKTSNTIGQIVGDIDDTLHLKGQLTLDNATFSVPSDGDGAGFGARVSFDNVGGDGGFDAVNGYYNTIKLIGTNTFKDQLTVHSKTLLQNGGSGSLVQYGYLTISQGAKDSDFSDVDIFINVAESGKNQGYGQLIIDPDIKVGNITFNSGSNINLYADNGGDNASTANYSSRTITVADNKAITFASGDHSIRSTIVTKTTTTDTIQTSENTITYEPSLVLTGTNTAQVVNNGSLEIQQPVTLSGGIVFNNNSKISLVNKSDITVTEDKTTYTLVDYKGNLTVTNSTLSNNANATLTMGSGTNLSIDSGSTFINKGAVTLEAGATSDIDVASLAVSQKIVDDNDDTTFNIIDLESALGNFNSSGSLTLKSANQSEAVEYGVNTDLTTLGELGVDFDNKTTGTDAKLIINNLALRVDGDLNLSSANIAANISGSTTDYGETELHSLDTLTFTTSSESNAENLNGLELVGVGTLHFKSGKDETDSILVSGSNTNEKQTTQFGVNQNLTSDGGKAIKFQNATLTLDNYSLDRYTLIKGNISSNLIMDSGSVLELANNSWTAQNITVQSGGKFNLDVSQSDMGLSAKNISVSGDGSAINVSGGYLTANTFDIANDSDGITVTNKAVITVNGDNQNNTVDFKGGTKISISNSSLNLGDVADTVGMTYADSKLSTGTDYKGFSGENVEISLNLDNVTGLTNNTLTLYQANGLLGLLTNSGSGLVHISGNIQPNITTTENQTTGETEVKFTDLASGGSLNMTFDTETTQSSVLTGVTNDVTGGWKAVQTETGDASVAANGTLSLQGTNTGNYAQDASGNVVGINLQEHSNLNLKATTSTDSGKGYVGEISGDATTTLTVANGADVNVVSSAGNDSLGDVDVGNLQGNGSLTANDITTTSANLTQGSVITAKTFTVSGAEAATKATGATINATEANFSGSAQLNSTTLTTTSDLNAQNLNLDESTKVQVSGSLTATNLSLDGESNVNVVENVKADNINVVGNATLTAQNVTLNANGELRVGQDLGENTTSSSANLVVTETLSLNGGSLIIDPDFTENTATAFAKTIGKLDTNSNMVIDGNIIVGRNSALGLGGDEAAFRENLARYQTNGKLTGNYGSYVYINTAKINLNGKQLIIGSESVETLESMLNTAGADVYLGNKSALQVSAQALGDAIDAQSQVFTSLTSADTIKVNGGTLIVPANMSNEQIKSIFGEQVQLASGSGTTSLTVTTENGLFTGTITTADQLHGNGFTMTLAKNARSILSGLSNPTYEYVIDVMDQGTNHYDNEKTFQEAVNAANTVTKAQTINPAYDPDATSVIDNSFGYQFLQDALGSLNSRAVETSARLATFGGAVQALQVATNSTTDAINSRLGMGNSASRLVAADNAQGAGLWVAPVYRNFSSDSFDGQGVSYGADVDLTGAALGVDYTLSNGIRVGGALNVGSGDADGQGAGAGVSNNFDYFGLALYAGFSPIQNLTLSADVSFTQVDNDLDAASGIVDYGKFTASTDSTAWSVGVGAQYLMQTASLDIAPHIGLRYTNFDVDDYDLKLDGKTLAHTDGDSASVFSIPFGVSLSKDLAAGDWTVRPAADFTVTLNLGDDDIDSTTSFDGVYGSDIKYNTEFSDNVTYGATLGVSAKNGNLSFGLNAGYTGSSNTDEYTVGANARFVF